MAAKKKRKLKFYIYESPMDMSFIMYGSGNPSTDSLIQKFTGHGNRKFAKNRLKYITSPTAK